MTEEALVCDAVLVGVVVAMSSATLSPLQPDTKI